MGLDMYAYATNEQPASPVDFSTDDYARLHYWRKHPNLHGWMENLYREKGGAAECFNCVSVELASEDLDRLEADVRAGNLPETSGFFFGASDGTEVEDDLAFIAKARQAISEGESVFYSSWW
ncbi:MAG: phosphoglycerate kinase [Pseudomonadota bacterium]